MPIWKGYNPPFLTADNVLPVQQDARLIKNDFIQLLLTNPGERVMKPDLGSPIPGLQFENIIDADIAVIRADIVNTAALYEPRITIKDVKIKIQPDDQMVTINIYGIVNLDSSEDFLIEVGISEGGVAFLRAS
jgi:phage baseplate assembly protein W